MLEPNSAKKLFCPIWLNQTQYFEDVSSQVPLEGYQVCQKWLNERQGCFLSEQDIQQYQRIVSRPNSFLSTIRLL
ncbi:hypothetical protein [Dendronalium sp. ChiSLP03b]|uniref:hypothetical protein n=1 Tax=Dendronalium sp. ChiSLP03b TaxID=3075381 RepID=UPI002AD5DA16|nr:hypothetical protein [Dendronalium sp. ChiSLP03b]